MDLELSINLSACPNAEELISVFDNMQHFLNKMVGQMLVGGAYTGSDRAVGHALNIAIKLRQARDSVKAIEAGLTPLSCGLLKLDGK